ncbi:MAG: hypothetical protein ACXACX_14180 [Candidatus Hodarchaeales archaeon]|jgi:hypothetical protein
MNQNSTTFHLYPELLDDLLNLEYIIVFNDHGLTLFSLDIGKIEIPDLLISGLLQAIITMLKEFNPQKLNIKENRLIVKEITDGDYGFLVYYCQSIPRDDRGIVIACFCSKLCSDHFKSRLKSITSSFADKFQEEIKNFDGNVSPFNEIAQSFFEETMWLNYLFPLKVANNLEKQNESNDEDISQLKSIINNLEGSLMYNEGFFLKEVIEKALRTLNISYFHLLQLVIDLVKKSYFIPVLTNGVAVSNDDEKEIKIDEDETIEKTENVISSTSDIPILAKTDTLKIGKENSIFDGNKTDPEGFVSPIKAKWTNDFFNHLSKSDLRKLSNKNLVISSVIREIEYSYQLKNYYILQGQNKDSIFKELSIIDHKLEEISNNLFSGPKFIFRSKLDKIFILSGIKYNDEYIVILFST